MNDYAFSLVNKAISIGSGLAISVALARFLGVELRGEFAFIAQVGSVLAIVGGIGLNQAFIYQFRRSPYPKTLRLATGLLTFQVALYALVGVSATAVSQSRTVGYIAALVVSLTLYQQLEGAMAAYDIKLKIKINIVYSLFRMVAFGLMWIWASVDLAWPVLIAVTANLLSSGLYLYLAVEGLPSRPTRRFARETFAFGWLPMLTMLLVVLNYNVDIVMLGTLGTGEDLGLYAVGAGIVMYLWVIPDAIKEVLVSRVVRTSEFRTVLVPLKVAVASGAFTILVVATLGKRLIPFFYGVEYSQSYPLVVTLSIGVVPMIYYKVLGVVLLAEGKRVFYFGALGVSVGANVMLNWWVIPEYGAMGAAFVSVAAYTMTGAFFIAYFCRVASIPLLEVLAVYRSDLAVLGQVIGRRR